MSSSQSHDLHRALLRPAVIHTLRAAGFHGTKPSVLDTLTNLVERHLLLLASSTAAHARSAHNDPVPTVSDVRMALTECGGLVPIEGAGEEAWRETMRGELGPMMHGGGAAVAARRVAAEKRKREDEDVRDVRRFRAWFEEGPQWREIRRVAGMAAPDALAAPGAGLAVGVGGGVVQAEDFLTTLKKRYLKPGMGLDDEQGGRFRGTVLGGHAQDQEEVLVEGGPVGRVWEWKPKVEDRVAARSQSTGTKEDTGFGSTKGTPPHEQEEAKMEELRTDDASE